MDLHLGEDFYDSFIEYQSRMLRVFDRMSNEFGFHTLNASRSVRSVAADLRRAVAKVVDELPLTEETSEARPTTVTQFSSPNSPAPIILADAKKKALP
jgi:hypothetical protein